MLIVYRHNYPLHPLHILRPHILLVRLRSHLHRIHCLHIQVPVRRTRHTRHTAALALDLFAAEALGKGWQVVQRMGYGKVVVLDNLYISILFDCTRCPWRLLGRMIIPLKMVTDIPYGLAGGA